MDVNKVDGAMIPIGTSNPGTDRELIPAGQESSGLCEIPDCKNEWKVICD